MAEAKGELQLWFEDFMKRWKPISSKKVIEFERKMQDRGPTGALCTNCKQRPIARGESMPTMLAAEKGLCHVCHKHGLEAGRALKKPKPQKKDVGYGTCVLCDLGPVHGGQSATAKQARAWKICSKCYCTGGVSKLKAKGVRRA